MNSPLGRNFPHWGKVEKRNREFLKCNFFSNIVWNIFICLHETELYKFSKNYYYLVPWFKKIFLMVISFYQKKFF